ncbi:MAG: sigma-70 family RNA polymerase sigma factor [Candidatus Binatia bacterium]|jgi:RNA polymerase sigma-70 factor, ECF subfamily
MSSGTIPYEEFAEVALSYFNQVHNAAQRLCRNPADADDLVQESYRLAFQHYRELRSLAHCRAWLYRILHRQVVTQHRRQRSGPPLVLIDGGRDDSGEAAPPAIFDGDLLEYISLQEVRAAIEALPSDLRIAVTLCDIEGFTYAEIADITGCPVGTVRSRIARARAKLMTKLQTHAEDCGIRRKTA